MALKSLSKITKHSTKATTGELLALATPPDVRWIATSKLKLWKDNPWKHDNVVPRLAELLALHGQVSSIIVWRKNNTVYKGNHTFKALNYLASNMGKVAKNIGKTEAEIRAVIDPSIVKAEFRDFASETAANAYGISDNNAGMGGQYDDAILRRLLSSDEEYFTSERTGFSDKELKQFKLSTDTNMERLGNIDLQGDTAAMGNFVILQFETLEEFQTFKTEVGMGKNERALMYSDLLSAMEK